VSKPPPQSVVSRVRQLMATNPHAKSNKGTEKFPLDEFVALLYEHNGSAYAMAKAVGMSHRVVANRRAFIERELDIVLPRGRVETWKSQAHRTIIKLGIDNATILMGSDLHVWPEVYGTAMAAFVDFNRRFKPDIVLLNGDGLDGAQISTHSRLGWDKRPSPAEEIEALVRLPRSTAQGQPERPLHPHAGKPRHPARDVPRFQCPAWWRA
jgi:hypothetical protein